MPANLKVKVVCLPVFLVFSGLIAIAQPSTGEEIIASYQQRHQLSENSIFKEYPVRPIGPVVMGGRVSDLAVNPHNVHEYFVGYASGGVFYTRDNGITFEPVFDNQGALGVGDMALAPSNPDILYVGTGEKNSSRSSYAGSGVYKSTDKGKSWNYLGLGDIHHTGRILVHPDNPDIVWVAALGALYSENSGRGVYKSTDGGLHWEQSLFINDSTGVVDLTINPENPDQLWAAAWERTRKAWNFKGNGSGSGIYRSDDGGNSWTRLESFPRQQWMGRIGLDVCLEQPNVLYALADNQQKSTESKPQKKDELKANDFENMSNSEFQELDSVKLNKYLRDHQFPKKYSSATVKREVQEGKYSPKALSDYLGDANKALLNSKIIGAELYRSNDYGDHWEKVNEYELEGVYNTYGYYFGEVRVVPNNPETVYIFGVPLLVSEDGGNTYHRIDTIGNVHVDHQALWINPADPEHLLLGNDGGLYLSYNSGQQWLHLNNTAVGQFYTVNVDMEKPYNVYGGLQDNGVYMGSSHTVSTISGLPSTTKHWERVMGGDGMFVAADPKNSKVVFTGFQFGNYFKVDRNTGKQTKITPQPDIGEAALRFNWRAPLVMSQHHSDIIYLGAQKLFRSMDQGNTWTAISEDLTRNLPQGNVPFSTITCVSESPRNFGLIYVGTDDGNIQVTRGGGNQWELISGDLSNLWVSSISPSSHDKAKVYVSLNGYRADDFRTYIYFSNDYGQTWQSLTGNLPEVVVNVIKQDPVNPDLLYLGTDHGAYASLDHGVNWHLLTEVPNVAVYDLMVHPRDNELVVATHGRSIYVVDVKPWQQVLSENRAGIKVFTPENVDYSETWGESKYPWSKPEIPTKSFQYYIGYTAEAVEMAISDETGEEIYRTSGPGDIGFHMISWDLKASPKKKRESPEYVKPGKFIVSISHQNRRDEATFLVEEKPKN